MASLGNRPITRVRGQPHLARVQNQMRGLRNQKQHIGRPVGSLQRRGQPQQVRDQPLGRKLDGFIGWKGRLDTEGESAGARL